MIVLSVKCADMNMRKGITIIESTLAICLICLLSTIAAPSVSKIVDAVEARQAAMEVETMFSSARHLAIARRAQTSVEIDTALRVIAVVAGQDTLRKRELGKDHRIDLKATRTSVTYSPIGVGFGAANVTVVVKRNASFDSIVVSRLGRVRR